MCRIRRVVGKPAHWIALALLAVPLSASPPVAVSPGSVSGGAATDSCPTFSWAGVHTPDGYELLVYRLENGSPAGEPLIREVLPARATSWTPTARQCLQAGAGYAWLVRALGAGSEDEWSEPALFEVALPSRAEVAEALETLRRYLEGDDEPADRPAGGDPLSAELLEELAAGRVPDPNPDARLGPSGTAELPMADPFWVSATREEGSVGPVVDQSHFGGTAALHAVESSSSDLSYGVWGESASVQGRGVVGWAKAASGVTYGVQGLSNSTQGRGVFGVTFTTDGVTTGVRGESLSTQGRGVFGLASTTSGGNHGVQGQSLSSQGRGVTGIAFATTGTPSGVWGQTFSTRGRGVRGQASTTSGVNYGVQGVAFSTQGRGVFGLAIATSGPNYGVYGQSSSTQGYGLFSWASATTGVNYGVYAKTFSPEGYASRFEGRHYVSTSIDDVATVDNHVARIENTSSGVSADVLALEVGGTDPGSAQNFITFFDANGGIGAIEGDGMGGISLSSASADFAEYLPQQDPSAELEPGEVVGLVDGRLTRRTDGAERVFVVTTAPIIVGNAPGGGAPPGHAAVAFLGQVPVRVRGAVAAGDYLVASGRNDGTATAVPAAALVPELVSTVVGRALGTDVEDGPVRALVGLFDAAAVGVRESHIRSLESRLERQGEEIEGLRARLAGVSPGAWER